MDKVIIEGLTLYSLIGVYDFERHQKQRVIADLVLHADLTSAITTDEVTNTVDYGKVAERLAELADGASFKLLEALGGAMIDMIFNEFSVDKLELTLRKPDILDNANSVGICFYRERSSL